MILNSAIEVEEFYKLTSYLWDEIIHFDKIYERQGRNKREYRFVQLHGEKYRIFYN